MISYFDAHCDTIWRCMETGPVADYGETEQEQRAFFKTGGGLRQNCGHVDLLRDRGFARRGQFFALYDDVKRLPEGTAWQRCCEMHDWFLRELAENGDMAVLCRSGAEADAAAESGRTAAFLSVEGADLLDCDTEKLRQAAAWGVRLVNPVWNNANALKMCIRDSRKGVAVGEDILRLLGLLSREIRFAGGHVLRQHLLQLGDVVGIVQPPHGHCTEACVGQLLKKFPVYLIVHVVASFFPAFPFCCGYYRPLAAVCQGPVKKKSTVLCEWCRCLPKCEKCA